MPASRVYSIKALLRSAEVFRQTKEAGQFGITTSKPELDFLKVQERKQSIIDTLHKGVQGLMKKERLTFMKGSEEFSGLPFFTDSRNDFCRDEQRGRE